MKKAVCISCTHHYHERIRPVEKVLQEEGYSCTYITSDFNHYTKAHYQVELQNCVQIPTRPYFKNISPQRLFSHICFAKDTIKKIAELQPDLLYIEVPPNSLCREAARYKKKHPQVKLIFDVFDMWPESFPNSRAKKLLKLPFSVWAWLRNSFISKADFVFTECELFRQKLQPYLKGTQSEILYLCRTDTTTDAPRTLPEQDAMHLCYLGNINNIIDIPMISALIGQIQKLRPVVLHIIGDGESREVFIDAVRAVGAQVEFHGKIYDADEKQAIFDICSFGLNIMKPSVCVGLTMKSVDYFASGLPILNSIPGDTWFFVENEAIGFNIDREALQKSVERIVACDDTQLFTLRSNALNIFRKLFSFEHFSSVLRNGLNRTKPTQ